MNNLLSFSSVKLDLLSKDGVHLKSVSGFIVETNNQHYLITNWHVISGNDIFAHVPRPVIEPHTLKTSIHIHGGEGENRFPLSMGVRRNITIQLYDDNLTPKWIEHRVKGQHQPAFDIVALPIPSDINLSLFIRNIATRHISGSYLNKNYWVKISSIALSAIDTDTEYGPSDAVHIIGYPLGWAPEGIDRSSSAFWRTSFIASEIYEMGMTRPNAFFVDPCAPEGMTGSPVVGMKGDCIKLLGVYSDTPTVASSANAGFVWDASQVKELIGIV